MGAPDLLNGDNAGHAILGAFLVWAIAMVRRILGKTLLVDERIDTLAKRVDAVELRLGHRIDELSDEADDTHERIHRRIDRLDPMGGYVVPPEAERGGLD